MLQKIDRALEQVNQALMGKEEPVKLALCCLLAGGHLLLEDLPGMGKTTLAHSLANCLGLSFKRIQFTSDLLPADILGGSVFDPSKGQFTFHEGPVFSQLLMADEINRATPRTQSALLEAMEERQVSLDGETHQLPKPFFVIATQNPSELAGTYALPESQTDRFLMCLSIGYPLPDAERELLLNPQSGARFNAIQPVISKQDLHEWQESLAKIHCSDAVLDYIQRLIQFTRESEAIILGISPRGGIALVKAARSYAKMHGRDFVTPDDVQAVFEAVINHRLHASDHYHDLPKNEQPRTLAQWIITSVSVL